MSRYETLTDLQTPVTRRTLVASGTKLAYAAPLVAASFRLTELTAHAEGAVSVPEEITNPGMFPPAIESVSFQAPGWVLITGRNLSDASVTFATTHGNIKASTRGKSHKGDIEGFIEVNTNDQVIVSVPDGITIFTTTVETPDGTDIFDKKVKSKQPDKNESDEAPEAEQESAPADEQTAEDAPVEEVRAEEPQPAEEPVQNDPVEPPAEEAPAAEAPVEETPAAEAPVEQPPAEEPPVEETPVEEPPDAEQPDETSTDG
jgi:hypothetical protein